MKSTRFWIIFFIILFVSSAASFYFFMGRGHTTANIYQDGECIHSIELSMVSKSYTIEINGKVQNTVEVAPGRIRIAAATCPDLVCVHTGWIEDGGVPIVCLPNALVIRIESGGTGDIDATVS